MRRAASVLARAAVALLSLALVAGTGYAWAAYRDLDSRLVTSDVIDRTAPPPTPDEPFTALVVGLDSRTDANGRPLPPELLEQLRAGGDEGQLHTDTIILLHVPAGPDARAVAVSFPRDAFVPIAGGGGRHKINSAYGRGLRDAEEALAAQGVTGADLERRSREAGRRTLVATVEALGGIQIDHYGEINLVGFVEITEAIGGVPVCLNHPVREMRSGVDLPAGPQSVQGADALSFVRQRRGLEDGDLDRIARQQAFLAGLASRLLRAGTLSDPVALDRLTDAVTRHVVLDRGWDLDGLVAQFRRMSGGDIRFVTIPTGTLALDTPVDGVAVEVDADEVRRFVRATVARGEPAAPPGAPEDTPESTPATRPRGPSPTGRAEPPGAPDRVTLSAAQVPCVD